MVLWEIALGTAYFLGLKRSYKLGLTIQRKLIADKHPKIRQFLQRRTRNIFDVALRVHLKIQERDIQIGRNLGNWILQGLNRMKPNVQIRKALLPGTNTSAKMTKLPNNSSKYNTQVVFSKYNSKYDRRLSVAAQNVWHKTFPTISMMMRPKSIVGHNIQLRQSNSGAAFFTVKCWKLGFGEVARNDVRQWLVHQ